MIFILYLGIVFGEIFSMKKRKSMEVELDVIENKICKGYLKPIDFKNATCKVLLESEEGHEYLSNMKLSTDNETHFSFSISSPKTLNMTLVPVVLDEEKPHVFGDVEFEFSAQFDTFKKDVAKKVSVEPAMAAMTKLDNLLYDLIRQSEELVRSIRDVDYKHKGMFSFVSAFSVVILMIQFAGNFYELYSLRKFFQKKKMI
ncbi:hypothetical protein HK407_02g03860 [Ordospora pajunii]|uniref:uncharacterized protein n=1 Tax=Ordospora pajunii TaxID=3039483 RepID=UPI0029528528|nr:uncharacterized protein HK407_02g03860 [Ordospora pajunii]KAH9411940.1 hypothetical protein HK407_02g03860 [Ordospora pajunii]